MQCATYVEQHSQDLLIKMSREFCSVKTTLKFGQTTLPQEQNAFIYGTIAKIPSGFLLEEQTKRLQQFLQDTKVGLENTGPSYQVAIHFDYLQSNTITNSLKVLN